MSRSAVSLVLNGRADGMISAAKQDAIRDAARRLSYVPNSIALSLRTNRTSTIGVIADTADTAPSIAETLLGAGIRAVQDGYLLMIIGLATTNGDEERAWEMLRTRQVDGLILVSRELCTRPSPELLRRVPAALANCVDSEQTVPSVVADETAAARLLTEHLLGYGHTEVALITPSAEAPVSRARIDGFESAMRAAGLRALGPVATAPGIADGYAAGIRLLSGDRPPTAIIAAGDRSAIGVSLAAAHLGLAVPVDLSLVTVEEDRRTVETMVPAVSAVRQPYVQIGQQVVEQVLSGLTRPSPAQQAEQQMVTGELIIRESVTTPRPDPR